MNEQLLYAMRDTFLALAEKHGVRVRDDVTDFFDDIVTYELGLDEAE